MAYYGGIATIANTIITPIYNIIFKHAMYPFNTSRNMKDLKGATQNLLAKSNDVRHQIEIANRTGMTASNEVQRWLENVDSIISDEEVIRGKYDQRCKIFGSCSLNCWSNYKISKHAAEMLANVQECAEIDTNIVVVTQLPPSVRAMPVLSNEQSTEDMNLQMALQCIKNDHVGMIGIWGLGGVGKTHLLKKINNSFVGDSFFDVVIFVTASKECSVEKMQAEIVKKFKLGKDDDAESQANIIYDFFDKRSFLVLLDDLWKQLDLQKVGIPYPLGIVGQFKRKVVLTTRSQAICGLMEVRKEIKVACLREDEAWMLFQEKVGEETLCSHPRINALAKDLVNELKGLPLSLITIGRAMYMKTDPREWKDTIRLLQQSRFDEVDPERTVLHQLKFSYDYLENDTLRRCFLTCCLWPEDCLIRKDSLIQCWIGLGLFDLVDEVGMQSSYDKGYALIGQLEKACLLESVNYHDDVDVMWIGKVIHGIPFSDFVKVHDVVREMALWISCGCGENKKKWIVNAGVGMSMSKKSILWNDAACVSLMNNALEELPPLGKNSLLLVMVPVP